MVQTPMEERGENGRKHVIKKRWTKHTENPRRGCIGKYNEIGGRHDNDQRKSYKIPGKSRKLERMLGTNRDDTVKILENIVKVQENVITTRGNGAKTIGNIGT